MFNRKKIKHLMEQYNELNERLQDKEDIFQKVLEVKNDLQYRNEKLEEELKTYRLEQEEAKTEEDFLKEEIDRKKRIARLKAENEQLDRQQELETEFRGLMNYSIKDAIGKGEQK